MSRTAPSFHAQLTSWKKGDHGQHHAGKEAQHWNGLQNVEQRNHETFRARTVSSDVSVGDREKQAQHIGQGDAQQRVSGIGRKRAEVAADFNLRCEGAEPVACDLHDAIEERQPAGKHDEVGQARRAGTRQHRPDANQRPESDSFRTLHNCTGVIVGGCGSPTGSASTSRCDARSKSKISA